MITREQIEAAVGSLEYAAQKCEHADVVHRHATLMRAIDGLIAERDEARLLARTFQAAPDMNGQAIMEARAYLAEHMGKQTECAFFDDCIHNAIALWAQAKSERDAAIAHAEAAEKERDHAIHEMDDAIEARDGARDKADRLRRDRHVLRSRCDALAAQVSALRTALGENIDCEISTADGPVPGLCAMHRAEAMIVYRDTAAAAAQHDAEVAERAVNPLLREI